MFRNFRRLSTRMTSGPFILRCEDILSITLQELVTTLQGTKLCTEPIIRSQVETPEGLDQRWCR